MSLEAGQEVNLLELVMLALLPALPSARWYYGFLRERSGRKKMWREWEDCENHDKYTNQCCFNNEKNFPPAPDGFNATVAILVALFCWPIILLIFAVMAKPKQTTLEARLEKQAYERRNAELEAELDRSRRELEGPSEIERLRAERDKYKKRYERERDRPDRKYIDRERY